MKSKGLLFTTDNVYGIGDGRKTQTRRTAGLDRVNQCPSEWQLSQLGDFPSDLGKRQKKFKDRFGATFRRLPSASPKVADEELPIVCPYGRPGDRLYVKETTIKVEEHGYAGPVYVASDLGQTLLSQGIAPSPEEPVDVEASQLRMRPSLFMRKSMARYHLAITDIRLERLNDISRGDALAEGIDVVGGATSTCPYRNYRIGKPGEMSVHASCPERSFMTLWESINGPGSWADSPWVWVVVFERIDERTDGVSA